MFSYLVSTIVFLLAGSEFPTTVVKKDYTKRTRRTMLPLDWGFNGYTFLMNSIEWLLTNDRQIRLLSCELVLIHITFKRDATVIKGIIQLIIRK